ncbi:MAG: hypothetical protein ABEJ66_00355 [Candidatus Nanohaloarchaea archaeon]
MGWQNDLWRFAKGAGIVAGAGATVLVFDHFLQDWRQEVLTTLAQEMEKTMNQ